MNINTLLSILCALVMLLVAPVTESGMGNDHVLMQAYIDEQDMDLFMSGEFDRQGLDIKVSNKETEIINSGFLSEANITVRTTVLVDISTSMPLHVRDKVLEFLECEIKELAKNEELKIVVFDGKTNVLQDFTSDRYDLSNAIKEIEFNGKQSAVYDALYNTIPQLGAENGAPVFYRTVLITDGVDSAAQGVTKEELLMQIRSETYPIDVISVHSKAPKTPNKELSVLSRISGGRYFDIYPEADASVCVSGISVNDFFWIRVKVPASLLDGSTRQVDVSDGNGLLTFDIKVSVVNTPVPESVSVSPSVSVSAELPVTEESKESPSNQADEPEVTLALSGVVVAAIVAVVAAALVAIIVIVVAVDKRKRDGKGKTGRKISIESADDTNGETELYDEVFAGENYKIKLSARNDPSMSWTLTIDRNMLIGRSENCAIRLDDKSVSREQCKIVVENAGIVAVNLSRSNLTKINGTRINDKALLHPGDVIGCGRVSLRVDLIQKLSAEMPCHVDSVSDSDRGYTESIF